ncbi:MAG: enoyl-CoA hydratase/isomerase family protein, partial [Candidatus Omnitrophica bacterium]|nr:enoyl-CoA hydratase/isomerase family protein [Candidatus Omnitrophota bacterium]
IDHPPVNVLNSQALLELNQALDDLNADPTVKVVIITGAGPNVFIAGADVKEIAAIEAAGKGEELALKGQTVINKIENSKKVFIAAVNGVCLGGGNELAMACHVRISSDRAKFGQPEILLGIIPGFGGTQRLLRLCGQAKARELVLTGDNVTAQEALRIGLVTKVVPDGEVLKQSLGLAKKIAAKGRRAIELAQEAITEGAKYSLDEALKLEAKLFGKVCETEDKKEGVKAFLEKRQPKFQDR